MGRKKRKRLFSTPKKKQRIHIPDDAADFTLDSLVATRVAERKEELELQKAAEAAAEIGELFGSVDIEPLMIRDGSIFDFSQGVCPVNVFELLGFDDIFPVRNCQPIPKWLLEAFSLHPTRVPPSADVLFGVFDIILSDLDNTMGDAIISYLGILPNGCLPYNIWLDYTREAMLSAPYLAVFFLLSGKLDLFCFEDEEEREKAPAQLTLLMCSAAMAPVISESPYFCHVIPNMQNLFNQTFSKEDIEFISTSCIKLISESGTPSISCFASSVPCVGVGIEIMWRVSTTLSISLLRANQIKESDPMKALAIASGAVKHLCESSEDSDLLYASAVLALIEKSAVTSIRLNRIDRKTMKLLCSNIRFSLNTKDPVMLTALKEQLHITRTQLSLLKRLTSDRDK